MKVECKMNFASLAQGGQVLRLIHEQETTVEQLQDLIESGLLSDLLKADVKKVNRDDFRKLLGLTFPELKIIVDYTKTLQEMIAAGHYDWLTTTSLQSGFRSREKANKN